MAGKILLIEGDADRRWRLAKAAGSGACLPGGAAEILFGDFERARAEATVGILRRNLPFNEIHFVRSGCEALDFLRCRGLQCGRERRSPPVLALLDEDLSGMAGHSILRSMFKLPQRGEFLVIILAGRERLPAHRQWSPEADGYLEKPFTFGKFSVSLQSLGTPRLLTCGTWHEAPT
jgi:two-component system, response regulator